MKFGNINALSKFSSAFTDKLQDNIMLNAFRIAVNGSLTQFNMLDGIVDEYEDESGIDNVNSTNESYNSTDDYYSPDNNSNIKLLLNLNGTNSAVLVLIFKKFSI